VRFLALATSDDAWFARLDPAEAREMARAEARRAWELYRDGLLREILFREDRRDVVMFLEADDEIAAREALASLPYVREGAITFEVIGLRPYDGWSRLFAEGS
jgi:hypothetical protein